MAIEFVQDSDFFKIGELLEYNIQKLMDIYTKFMRIQEESYNNHKNYAIIGSRNLKIRKI